MIRPFRLRDILLVKQLQQSGTPLDIEEQLTQPRSPLHSALADKLFRPHSGSSTFLFDQKTEQGRTLGLAQLRSRPGQQERDVVFMTPTLGAGNGEYAIWQRLLAHLCIKTGEQGGLRLFARLSAGGNEIQLFKHVGFNEYCQEDIFQLESPNNSQIWQPRLLFRPQISEDGWGLQKLYTMLTPRLVQNAEGLAQGQWALPQRWGEQGQRKGYIWEVEGEIMGALHMRIGNQGIWMRSLLHSGCLDQLEAFIETALSLTKPYASLPIYFAQRQYEAGWSNILPLLGFYPITSQSLVVKHLTVSVRRKRSITPIPTVLNETPVVSGQTSVVSSQITISRQQNGNQ